MTEIDPKYVTVHKNCHVCGRLCALSPVKGLLARHNRWLQSNMTGHVHSEKCPGSCQLPSGFVRSDC